jgi:predicted metal-dependent hydrolase
LTVGAARTSRDFIFHDKPAGSKISSQAWARKIGVEPKEIHLRPMKRKWASCSTKGRLTFDTGLLSQPAAFRREVIVHELLHLKVPNHGPVFRSLLRAYLG